MVTRLLKSGLYLFEKRSVRWCEEYSRCENYLHESTSAFVVVSGDLESTAMEDGGEERDG